MKYFLLLTGFLITLTANACDCMEPKFLEKYIQSDFVARITITKTFPNQGSSFYYKSDIVIHELFKGRLASSLFIMGSSDGKQRTSCDVFLEKGSEMLVYAKKGNEDHYFFNSCAGYVVLGNIRSDKEKRELEMLNFLKQKSIVATSRTHYGVDISEKLKVFQGESLTKSFAIFEVTFKNNLQVDTVKTITGFRTDLDNKLIAIIKASRWVSDQPVSNAAQNQNSPGSKLLFAFYYYPAQGKYSSIISEYDL